MPPRTKKLFHCLSLNDLPVLPFLAPRAFAPWPTALSHPRSVFTAAAERSASKSVHSSLQSLVDEYVAAEEKKAFVNSQDAELAALRKIVDQLKISNRKPLNNGQRWMGVNIQAATPTSGELVTQQERKLLIAKAAKTRQPNVAETSHKDPNGRHVVLSSDDKRKFCKLKPCLDNQCGYRHKQSQKRVAVGQEVYTVGAMGQHKVDTASGCVSRREDLGVQNTAARVDSRSRGEGSVGEPHNHLQGVGIIAKPTMSVVSNVVDVKSSSEAGDYPSSSSLQAQEQSPIPFGNLQHQELGDLLPDAAPYEQLIGQAPVASSQRYHWQPTLPQTPVSSTILNECDRGSLSLNDDPSGSQVRNAKYIPHGAQTQQGLRNSAPSNFLDDQSARELPIGAPQGHVEVSETSAVAISEVAAVEQIPASLTKGFRRLQLSHNLIKTSATSIVSKNTVSQHPESGMGRPKTRTRAIDRTSRILRRSLINPRMAIGLSTRTSKSQRRSSKQISVAQKQKSMTRDNKMQIGQKPVLEYKGLRRRIICNEALHGTYFKPVVAWRFSALSNHKPLKRRVLVRRGNGQKKEPGTQFTSTQAPESRQIYDEKDQRAFRTYQFEPYQKRTKVVAQESPITYFIYHKNTMRLNPAYNKSLLTGKVVRRTLNKVIPRRIGSASKSRSRRESKRHANRTTTTNHSVKPQKPLRVWKLLALADTPEEAQLSRMWSVQFSALYRKLLAKATTQDAEQSNNLAWLGEGDLLSSKQLLPVVEEVMNCDNAAAFSNQWGLIDPFTQSKIWPFLMLNLLHRNPKTALEFLLATRSQSIPPAYAVHDSLEYIVQHEIEQEPSLSELDAGNLCDTVCQLLLAKRPQLLYLSQRTIWHLSIRLTEEQLQSFYAVLQQVGQEISPDTHLHIIEKFAKYNKTVDAMKALNTLHAQGADFSLLQVATVCASILTYRNREIDANLTDSDIFGHMLSFGLQPSIVFYNILIQNAIKASDSETAWRIYEMMIDQNLEADSYTFSILLNDAKWRLDRHDINRVLMAAAAKAVRSPHIVTDQLHTVFLLHEQDLREKVHTKTFVPAKLIDLYASYFQLEPLQLLLPHFVNSRRAKGLPEPLGVERLPPPFPTITVMVLGALRHRSHAGEVADFYYRFRNLVALRHPGVKEIAEDTTVLWDGIIKALAVDYVNLHLCMSVIKDMLTGTLPQNDLVLRENARLVNTAGEPPTGLYKFVQLTMDLDNFSPLPEPIKIPPPSVTTWSVLLKAFMDHRQPLAAEKVLSMMQERGIPPNIITWTSLLNGYARLQDVPNTINTIDRLERAGLNVHELSVDALSTIQNKAALRSSMEKLADRRSRELAESAEELVRLQLEQARQAGEMEEEEIANWEASSSA